jgi:hypothetical protein
MLKSRRLVLSVFFVFLFALEVRPQGAPPPIDSSESVDIGGYKIQLGIQLDVIARSLASDYNVEQVGAAPGGESTWIVETKAGPPQIRVASLTISGGKLSSVYKYWAAASEPGMEASFAGTLYGAIAKFEQENGAPCEVATRRSQQPAGDLRTVVVTCKGRQKSLNIDLVPAGKGRESVSVAEVLKYASEEIEVPGGPGAAEASGETVESSPESVRHEAAQPEPAVAPEQGSKFVAYPRPLRGKADTWYPADVDDDVPEVKSGTACPMDDVLLKAAKRIRELVDNVDKFTATEVVEHQGFDQVGRPRPPERRQFNYLVSIRQAASGYLNVEEYRNGGSGPDQFPDHIATVGTPSLVLIFHPNHAKDFRMTCEGLGEWDGKPAWQIRFEERTDRHNSISALVMNGRSFGLRLRGRAWILADSYQVARLESDLINEIPEVRLRLQHEDIEYRPVKFRTGKIEIWLPSTCKFYMDFHGHRFYRLHRFTDFQLFSVNVRQGVDNPNE